MSGEDSLLFPDDERDDRRGQGAAKEELVNKSEWDEVKRFTWITNFDGEDMDTSFITTDDDAAVVGRRRGSCRLLDTPWALLNEELDLLTLWPFEEEFLELAFGSILRLNILVMWVSDRKRKGVIETRGSQIDQELRP